MIVAPESDGVLSEVRQRQIHPAVVIKIEHGDAQRLWPSLGGHG